MPRLLHTADWQIGRRYAQFEADAAVHLTDQRITTVAAIAQLATERTVDAVLVAGDIFDQQTVSELTIRRLFKALAGYTGRWILLPGNHDAALTEGVWATAERLQVVPSNVTVVREPGLVPLEHCRTGVLTAPLTQRHTYNDATEHFDRLETPPGWLRVGLAHGSVAGVLDEGIDSTNPIAADRVERAQLDYLALGDWHGFKRIHVRCAYAGTPEPDRFKDNQPGHCLIIDLEPGVEPRIEPVRIGRYVWRSLQRDLRVPADVDALADELGAFGEQDVIELAVTGAVDLAGLNRLKAAIDAAQAAARALHYDLSAVRMLPTDEDLARLHADGFVADVIAELRTEQAGDQTEAAARARDALQLLCTEMTALGSRA